jgi:hypothetical protein
MLLVSPSIVNPCLRIASHPRIQSSEMPSVIINSCNSVDFPYLTGKVTFPNVFNFLLWTSYKLKSSVLQVSRLCKGNFLNNFSWIILLAAPVSKRAWKGIWKLVKGILGVDSLVCVVNLAICRDLLWGSLSTDPKPQLIFTGFPAAVVGLVY